MAERASQKWLMMADDSSRISSPSNKGKEINVHVSTSAVERTQSYRGPGLP